MFYKGLLRCGIEGRIILDSSDEERRFPEAKTIRPTMRLPP